MRADRAPYWIIVIIILIISFFPTGNVSAAGEISLNELGTPYFQDFDTLAFIGTSDVTPAGWYFFETGTSGNVDGLYRAGTGSSTAGDTYSFGAAGSSERAFGTLRSGTLEPTIGAKFVNNTGYPIQSLQISYYGEQWRRGSAVERADFLRFQLSIDATSLNDGSWVNYPALDFASPITTGGSGALNGNDPANRTLITYTITGLCIQNAETFWIRWWDQVIPGAEDGLAIDDFSLTPFTEPDEITLSSIGGVYSQDFNTLASVGQSSCLPGGWYLHESGTSGNVDGLYTAGTGSSPVGDVYSFGALGSLERALGTLRTGTLIPLIGARFVNDTGFSINSLEINYTGE